MKIQDLIKQHPTSAALLFAKFGYPAAPVTEKTALALAAKFGSEFIYQFGEVMAAQYDVFVGADGVRSLAPVPLKLGLQRDSRNINASALLRPKALSIAPKSIDPNYAAAKIEQIKSSSKPAPEKVSLKDKIINLFNKALPVLNAGAAILTGPGVQNPTYGYDPNYQDPATKNNPSKWLIAGVVIIVLLSIVAFVGGGGESKKVMK